MALTYSITGGADAAVFNINPTSRRLTFKAAAETSNIPAMPTRQHLPGRGRRVAMGTRPTNR